MMINLKGYLYAETSPEGIDFLLLDRPLTEEDFKKFKEVLRWVPFLDTEEILEESKRGYISSLFSDTIKGNYIEHYLEKFIGKKVKITISEIGGEEG